jgi:anti-sigma factor RsiW
MNPCSNNRKQIAWLALGELDPAGERTLREHLATCEGCRNYLEEISGVTEQLSAAAPDSKIRTPDLFHQRLTQKLRAAERNSVLEDLPGWFGRMTPGWRVALPGIAVVLLVVFAVVARRQPSNVAVAPAPAVVVVTAPDSGSDPAPTMANYQMIAGQSLDKLDALLTKEGNENLPPAPVYTASMTKLSDAL